MLLVWFLGVTFGSGLLAWAIGERHRTLSRSACFVGLSIDWVLLFILWLRGWRAAVPPGTWVADFRAAWVPSLGISFHLTMDGLTLPLAALTVFMGAACIAGSRMVERRVGAFHLMVMSALTGILGVFTAMDLFLFYFFWELMLVPVFFLIAVWGGQARAPAALKFFIFTQASGLLMLLAIIALYWIRGRSTGEYTFNYAQMMRSPMPGYPWVILGFCAAFAVKLPVVPVHLWLPNAYAEAPMAGSIILASLMSKTGAYGFMRFVLPLIAGADNPYFNVARILALVGIFYGAFTAFAQKDLKRLIAYSSVSHLGFVLLGIFAGSQMALQGVVIIMLAHGLSTGGLFIVAGALHQRIGTTDMDRMGGLWAAIPRMGGATMFFMLASLSLPGMANFVGEFMVLTGTFQMNYWFGGIAALAMVVSVIYNLAIIDRVFHGPLHHRMSVPDLTINEMANLAMVMIGLLWIGFFPQPVVTVTKEALQGLRTGGAVVRTDEAAVPEHELHAATTRGAGRGNTGDCR